MNVKFFIKRLLVNSCIFFSLVMMIYTVFMFIVNVTEYEVLLEAERVVLFYVFSLLFSAANSVKKIKALHKAVALLLHFVITVFAFYACLLLPLNMIARDVFVGISVYTVIYVVVSVIISAFKSRFKANAEVNEVYEAQFTKSKK